LRHDETTVPPWRYCGMESDAYMNLRALAINEEALKSLEECIKELDELHQEDRRAAAPA
jgi:hypothetical protein